MRKINTLLKLLIIVVLVPLVAAILYQNIQLEEIIKGKNQTESQNDEQVVGIVAKEISIYKPEECIKAQSVIARTNLLAAKENGTVMPEQMTVEEMQMLWGEAFSENYEKMKMLVKATGNEVLTYEGNYIYAAFHAASAGNTRNMSEIYPDTNMPYLSAKECHKDTSAENYLSVYFWKETEFLELCQKAFPENEIQNVEEISVETRDSSGYAISVKVGQTSCSGEDFRNALGLESSNIAITRVDENIRVVVMGLGHGLGLSQSMAEQLAEEGQNYKEILQYFYTGVEITE